MVQFYPWFKIYFLLFETNYYLIIRHYHTQEQKKIIFEGRIKLNHNIYIQLIHFHLHHYNHLIQNLNIDLFSFIDQHFVVISFS